MKRRGPLFVAQRSYRLRRLRDGARLLPILGGFLFLLPILWSPGQTERRDTAPDGIFLFAVWGVLILIAVFLSRRLMDQADTPAGAPEEDD
jgi:hypothetical protein